MDLSTYLKCPNIIIKILPKGKIIKQTNKFAIKFKIPFTKKSKVFQNIGNHIGVENMVNYSLSEQSKSKIIN